MEDKALAVQKYKGRANFTFQAKLINSKKYTIKQVI